LLFDDAFTSSKKQAPDRPHILLCCHHVLLSVTAASVAAASVAAAKAAGSVTVAGMSCSNTLHLMQYI